MIRAAAGLACVLFIACDGDGRPTPVPPFPAQRTPASYHIVLRVDLPGGITQFEERWVRRPYLGRTDIKKSDGELISSLLSNESGFYIYAEGFYHQFSGGRHRSSSDQRPLEGLRYGEKLKVVERTASESIAGRRCVVGRTGARPGQPMTATTGVMVEEFCVDETGIALREASYEKGALLRGATMVSLEADPVIADAIFSPANIGDPFPGQDVESKEFDVSIIRLPVWRLTPSSGFRLDGGIASVRSASLGIPLTEESVGITLLYTRGSDLLEVEEHLRGGAPFDPDEGVPVTLPGLGDGRIVPNLTVNELRLGPLSEKDLPRYVVLRGALAPDELRDAAANLAKA